MHCNIFFPNSISIQKILWINSGKQVSLAGHLLVTTSSSWERLTRNLARDLNQGLEGNPPRKHH